MKFSLVYLKVTNGLNKTFNKYLTPRLKSRKRALILSPSGRMTELSFLSSQSIHPIDVTSINGSVLLECLCFSSFMLERAVLRVPRNQTRSKLCKRCVKFPKLCVAFNTISTGFLRRPDDIWMWISYS